MARFRIREKRTPTAARELLIAHLRHGRGGAPSGYNLRTEEGINKLLADHDYPTFEKLAEELRHKDAVLPLEAHIDFGDLMPTISLDLGPGSHFAIRGEGEKEIASIEGESGTIVTSAYQARFLDSIRNLNRCTNGEKASYGDLLSCFADGLSSIEAWVNYRTERHRRNLPRGNERLVPLDFKISDWIPRIHGVEVNKSERRWQNFKEIRRIRNEYQSHPDTHVYSTSDQQFCQRLNLWRTGIARFLLELHVIMDSRTPVNIVKHAYLPDIEIRDN